VHRCPNTDSVTSCIVDETASDQSEDQSAAMVQPAFAVLSFHVYTVKYVYHHFVRSFGIVQMQMQFVFFHLLSVSYAAEFVLCCTIVKKNF